ncbi:hypothetical protein [Micromonospora sp. NPDC023888]|uniref:hypothetical protein n=1 Tax=unclassified Micromonospora TaxID=2617518 RepID=UPI0033F4CBE6
MTTSGPSDRPERGAERQNWVERRREKIRAEVDRNRRGEYTVPTWVLALALVLIVGGWLALIFLA